jgi:alanine racemase
MMYKWVEIDAEKVLRNAAAVLETVPPEVSVLAVLKNNAYGQGAVGMGQLLSRLGITYFGVSYLDEALELRQAGIDADILIFSPLLDEEEISAAHQHNLTVTVSSGYDLERIQEASGRLNFRLRVHVKMDTGLSRFGFSLEQLLPACQVLQKNDRILLEGLYTHMADPGNRAFTERQFSLFQQGSVLCGQEGIRFHLYHCAGSEVFLRYPEMHLDMVRLGTLFTGQYPAGIRRSDQTLRLQDPFAFKTKVVAVHRRAAGAGLGYKRAYRLGRPADIAVIPAGYADGVTLDVGNPPSNLWDLGKKLLKQALAFFRVRRFTQHVKVNHRLIPVRGKVFMQMTLLELPAGFHVQPGDEAEVPVRKTLIGREVTRFTIREGQAAKLDNFYTPKA